jgi:hypothetical protein
MKIASTLDEARYYDGNEGKIFNGVMPSFHQSSWHQQAHVSMLQTSISKVLRNAKPH